MALDIVAWGAITFGLTAGIQIAFFLLATFLKTDRVTDFSAALTFFVLALVGLLWPSDYFARQVVLCSLQMLWAIRLGLYLTTRVMKRGKDARFDEIRNVWWKWGLFWSTQITWIWVVSLPVTFIVATHENKALDAVDYVGWAIFGVALLTETIADAHRSHFNKSKKEGEVKFIESGLWYWSRHPNYCAEIFVWIGIWLSSSNGLWGIDTAYGVLGLFSPLITFVLLAFISGIPPSEKRDDERFQHLDSYYDYKKRTSPLWFFPTSLYRGMPMNLRKVPFVDLRDYTKLKRDAGQPQDPGAVSGPASPVESTPQ